VEHRPAVRAVAGRARAARGRRRCRARRARGERRGVRRRDDRDGRLPHGVLPGSRRQRAASASEVRRMIVEHVDFWTVTVTDMERSKAYYGETLGLEQTGKVGFPEFKLGDNGFLYLLKLEEIGSAFRAPHDAGFALRVPDVAEARRELEEKSVVFNGD